MSLITWEVLERMPDGSLNVAYDTSDEDEAEAAFDDICANANVECVIHLVRCESVKEFQVAVNPA